MIKAVIFDFDETLCFNEESFFHLENEVLALMGRSPQDRQVHKDTWGEYLDIALQKRSPGVDPTEFRKIEMPLLKGYIQSGKLDRVPEKNLKVLDQLALEGKQLMLLTGRDGEEVEHLIDPSHHLGSRISHFYHRANNDFYKPDPRTFEIIKKQHKLKPNECVYVGDTPGDAAAAKGAGLHFIASLESGLRTKEDFKDYPVDVFIKKFPEVIDAIKSFE
jgi:phosphoglycolate phosphatase